MKILVLAAVLSITACAHEAADTTPYERGVVPPSPTHCGDVTCATHEYCRSKGSTVGCVSIPVLGL